MSMVQDYAQQRPCGDSAGLRFHSRQGSASSVLAATTFGVPYNPLATPSHVSAYGSMSWSSSVSPSIWSHNHQGRVQWPSTSSMERQAPPYVGEYGNYAYMPRGGYGSQMYQPQPQQQHPSMPASHMAAQHMRQTNDQQQQMMMIPQVQPQMQAPLQQQVQQVPPQLMAPYMHAAPIHPSAVSQMQVPPQFAMRAPLQPYQNITPPESTVPYSEYDFASFSKFYVAVAKGIFVEELTAAETSTLDQFVTSILCATRLPKSTVLMSFVFLNQWHKITSNDVQSASLSTRIVCALVLANKMNDDNTFTNASWGMVSGIPAQEITKLELVWLDALDWRLNLDENGVAEWNYWKKCWDQYESSSAPNPCMQSPVSMQGIWTPGFVYEPFSVAVC